MKSINKANKDHHCDTCKRGVRKGERYTYKKHYLSDEDEFFTIREIMCVKCIEGLPQFEYRVKSRAIRVAKRVANCPDADFKTVWNGGWSDGCVDGGDVEWECHACNIICR